MICNVICALNKIKIMQIKSMVVIIPHIQMLQLMMMMTNTTTVTTKKKNVILLTTSKQFTIEIMTNKKMMMKTIINVQTQWQKIQKKKSVALEMGNNLDNTMNEFDNVNDDVNKHSSAIKEEFS